MLPCTHLELRASPQGARLGLFWVLTFLGGTPGKKTELEDSERNPAALNVYRAPATHLVLVRELEDHGAEGAQACVCKRPNHTT